MGFPERLIRAMKAKGVTAYRVAKDLKITEGTVRNWKRGNNWPDMKHTAALAEYLDVSASWLMYGESTLKVAEDDAVYQDPVFVRMLERMTRIYKEATKSGDYKRLAALQAVVEAMDHED